MKWYQYWNQLKYFILDLFPRKCYLVTEQLNGSETGQWETSYLIFLNWYEYEQYSKIDVVIGVERLVEFDKYGRVELIPDSLIPTWVEKTLSPKFIWNIRNLYSKLQEQYGKVN